MTSLRKKKNFPTALKKSTLVNNLGTEKNQKMHPSKKKPRRGFFWLVICFLLVVLALVLHFIWQKETIFPIKQVKIHATFQHLQSKFLKNTILPFVDQGFFGLNASALSQQLLQMPWVKNVSVQRIWPNKIIIVLEEQKPIAIWNNKALLNQDGEIFAPQKNTFPKNLPQLFGADADVANILQNYLTMNRLLKPLGYFISQFKVDDRNSLTIILNNGLILYLGQKDQLDRLQLFIKVYPKISKQTKRTAKSVDLRYNDGLAIKWGYRKTED